jgi:hypothetical protein
MAEEEGLTRWRSGLRPKPARRSGLPISLLSVLRPGSAARNPSVLARPAQTWRRRRDWLPSAGAAALAQRAPYLRSRARSVDPGELAPTSDFKSVAGLYRPNGSKRGSLRPCLATEADGVVWTYAKLGWTEC